MVLVPLAAILVVAGIVFVATEPVAGLALLARSEVFWAFVISGVGALAGGVALGGCARFFPDFLAQGVLAATALRMFITLAGILVFVLILPNVGLKFFLCTIGFYLVGLISETIIALSVVPRGTGFHAHPKPERKEI
jgi:hypothetical protein